MVYFILFIVLLLFVPVKIVIKALPKADHLEVALFLRATKKYEHLLTEKNIKYINKKDKKNEKKKATPWIIRAIFERPGNLPVALNAKVNITYSVYLPQPLKIMLLLNAAVPAVIHFLRYVTNKKEIQVKRMELCAHDALEAEGIFTIVLFHIIYVMIKYAVRKVKKSAGTSYFAGNGSVNELH